MNISLQKFLKHPATMTMCMTASIIIGGIFGYVFQLFMIGNLASHEFLEFQRYLSFSNIAGTIFAGLTIYMSQHASLLLDKKYEQKTLWYGILFTMKQYAGSILSMSVIILCIGYIAFDLHNRNFLLLVIIQVVVSIVAATSMGILRGLQRFLPIIVVQIIGPLAKLLGGRGVVAGNLGSFGALFACVLATIVPLFRMFRVVTRHYRSVEYEKKIVILDQKQLLVTSSMVILLGFLMNMDVLMVHRAVDTEYASAYVSLALLFKSLVFIVGAMEIVLLNQAANAASKYFVGKILLAIVLCTLFAIVFASYLGPFVVSSMKPGLIDFVRLLVPGLGLMGCYGIVSFLSQYIILVSEQQKYYQYALIVMIVLWYAYVRFVDINTLQEYFMSLYCLFSSLIIISIGTLCFVKIPKK